MATMSALMRLIGATSESRNETISLLAKRLISATPTNGEDWPSVMPIAVAPVDLANCIALIVREE